MSSVLSSNPGPAVACHFSEGAQEESELPSGCVVVSNYGVLTVYPALRRSHVNLPCDPAQGGGPTFPFRRQRN